MRVKSQGGLNAQKYGISFENFFFDLFNHHKCLAGQKIAIIFFYIKGLARNGLMKHTTRIVILVVHSTSNLRGQIDDLF